MRKGAKGFLAKLLIAVLILSFALWGVSDVFRSAPNNVIATVAGEPITAEELSNAIRAQQAYIPELTADVAASLPVRLQFLQRIINSRLLAAEAKSLGIDFSEEALSEQIANDPAFHNSEGRFSRDKFTAILRQNNLNQALFLQRFETDMQISLLHKAVTGSVITPKSLAELYYHVQNEQRKAKILLVNKKDIKAPESPTTEELQAMYDATAEQFREPEYRTYRYMSFNADMIAKRIQKDVSEEEARAFYEQNPDEFAGSDGTAPSFEDVEDQVKSILSQRQMTDKLIALSNQLDDSLAGGATLEEALKLAGLSELKIETLGPISSGGALPNGEIYEMSRLDEEMLKTAYEQDEGEISPISISADHYYYLVETLEVKPSDIPPFDRVKADLANQAMQAKTKEALQIKADALAVELQHTEHPVAAVKERGLRLYESGTISRSDTRLKNAPKLKTQVLTPTFINTIFALKVNEVSDAITLPGERAAIVILQKIIPAEAPDEQALSAIQEELSRQLEVEQFEAYLEALREKHGVELMMDQIVATSGGVES